MSARGLHADERGFTLIEVLVTMIILVVGMGGALALIDGAAARTSATKQREGATGLAREVVESARAVPYNKITSSGVRVELRNLPGLADSSSAAGWQVKRRETVYTLSVTACSMDDPQDGIGDHAAGTGAYCSNPAVTSPADRNPDDYKRVVLRLEWTDRGIERSIRHVAVIANESSTSGPRIVAMSRAPSDDPITSKSVTSIAFNATTDRKAAAIKYAVDGSIKKTDTPTGVSSSFSWQIDGEGEPHVPDGTYLVTATAFDSLGQPGVARSLTVRLNRDSPAPVEGVVGGWNATRGMSEIAWQLNNESDILGYRVYVSADGGARELVPGCNVDATTTRCVDQAPPAGELAYYVVALDSDGLTDSPREGDLSLPLVVTRTANRPNPPAELTYKTVGRDVVLEWTTPAPADPSYDGDAIDHFWIYRDGELVGQRLDFTALGTDTTFTDVDAAGGSHTYWVTAVDQNFSESVTLGPVPGT